MSTKQTIQRYFEELKQKRDWQSFLAEDMVFTSYVSPIKEVKGKTAYIESTRRFFSMITAVEVRELIIEGEKACALTQYALQSPARTKFNSDVAEIFTVKNDKIASLAIYFDTAPFPK